MILIAEAGSTKTDWLLLDENAQVVLETQTLGINPSVFDIAVLEKRIKDNSTLFSLKENITQIEFFGAGCGTEQPRKALKELLQRLFQNAKVAVYEDTYAAALAVTTQPGIVCILGTGSNSCYFDGNQIHLKFPSLGYTLMDEASGNYFGKRLIRDYFYEIMPEKLRVNFSKSFNLDPDEIKHNLYKKENPNAYLASFAAFIYAQEENDYFKHLITEGINEFIEKRVLCYAEAGKLPIHFVGSIAHYSRGIIADSLKAYNLTLGNIIQRPVDGLVNHYCNKK